MPYRLVWTPSDVLFEYKDVKVYRAYENDSENYPLRYWVSFVDEPGQRFTDVRSLRAAKGLYESAYDGTANPTTLWIAEVLTRAIDRGELPLAVTAANPSS